MKKVMMLGALMVGLLMPHTAVAQNENDGEVNVQTMTAGVTDTTVVKTAGEEADSLAAELLDEVGQGDVQSAGEISPEMVRQIIDQYREETQSNQWEVTIDNIRRIISDVLQVSIPLSITVVLPIVIITLVLRHKRRRNAERIRMIEKLIDKDMDVSQLVEIEKSSKPSGQKPQVWLMVVLASLYGVMMLLWFIIFLNGHGLVPLAAMAVMFLLTVLGLVAVILYLIYVTRKQKRSDMAKETEDK